MIWAAIASLGVEVASNIFGQLMANGQYQEAMQLKMAAAQAWNIPLPKFDELVAQQVQHDFSDQPVKAAQMSALAKLQEVADAKGMDPQSQAAMMHAEASSGNQIRAQNAAVMANRAARGISGAGDELTAQLVGNQGANQNYALQSADAAASARQRALQALSASGSLAGQIRGQDLAQGNAEAELAKFNAGLRQSANQYNIEQQQELVRLAMQRASGYANALNGVANQANDQGNRIGNTAAAAGQAAGDALTGYGIYSSYGGGGGNDLAMPADVPAPNGDSGVIGSFGATLPSSGWNSYAPSPDEDPYNRQGVR